MPRVTKTYSTLTGDAKASAEAKASKGAGKPLVYDKEASIKQGRNVFKPAGGKGMRYDEGGRVERILKRAKKKAKRIHDREAKKEAKGKKVEVIGTRTERYGGTPRNLDDFQTRKVKVYAKEREAINKGDVKAAKVEAKEKDKGGSTPTTSKAPKIKRGKGKKIFGLSGKRGGRAGKPRRRPIKNICKKITERAKLRKLGCL
jgi:hypothetical protein